MQNLKKKWKQSPVVVLQQVIFYNIFYSVLVAKNHQKIQSRCLVYEFSFRDFFLMMMMMMNCFCGMVDWQKAFHLISSARAIVRDPHHCKFGPFGHPVSRIWTCAESDFRLCFEWHCAVVITITQRHHNDINHAYKEAILKKNSLWLLPFDIAAATYCHHEKVHRTMCIAIASYLLNSNKFELTHLNKNMKRKKNYSKNFS